MILDEIFGNTFEFDHDNILSSAQIPPPTNKLSELDIIYKLKEKKENNNMTNDMMTSKRDLITEAMESKKQLLKSKKQSQQHRISKSKPSKYKSPNGRHSIEENKNVSSFFFLL
jgi:hypothetical protein